jgi:Spy/CpxP family protein refolding chaperone
MKKNIYFLVFFCCFSFALTAQPVDMQQPPLQQRPNIAGLKMAFVNKQLALTNDEAQKFWPVYREYNKELRTARQDKKEDVLAFEENVLNVRKKYRTEFKKILITDDRVNKALTVDREFMNVIKKERRMRGGKRIPENGN